MVTANRSFLYYLLLSTLILPTLTGCKKINASVDVTSFRCIQEGENWQTIAQKGNKASNSPLLAWKTTEFGANYTPDGRCKIVSKKLTETVADNGGRLGNLALTYGTVNNQTVICAIPLKQTQCNEQNMLFTLNQKNAQNPGQVLADMKAFRKGEDKTIDESGLPQYILLEDLVENSMSSDDW